MDLYYQALQVEMTLKLVKVFIDDIRIERFLNKISAIDEEWILNLLTKPVHNSFNHITLEFIVPTYLHWKDLSLA